MANWADIVATQGSFLPSLDSFIPIWLAKTVNGGIPNRARIISVCGCCSWNPGRGFGRLITVTGLLEDEGVVIIHVIHNQVNWCSFQRLVSSPELLNNIGVAAVEGTHEDHDEKKGGMTTLHCTISRMRQSNWGQIATILKMNIKGKSECY